MEFFCLTPLPGSEDHQRLYLAKGYLDPDLNKYDLEHATTTHPTMSKAQWEQVYRDAWAAYYTPAHMERVLRRAVATGVNAGNILFLLLWFHGCITLEKIHPLEGGDLRRKYRKDRRPTFPVESPFLFYPRYVLDFVSKHIKLARLIWRYGRFRQGLKRDPEAKNYTDLALKPIFEDEFDSLEMFNVSAAAKSEIVKLHTQTEALKARGNIAAKTGQ